MMNAQQATKKYVEFISRRSNLNDQQRKDIEETIGVLVQEIINQVKLATISAIDAESRPVIFQGIQ
jgi:hypothetical protein